MSEQISLYCSIATYTSLSSIKLLWHTGEAMQKAFNMSFYKSLKILYFFQHGSWIQINQSPLAIFYGCLNRQHGSGFFSFVVPWQRKLAIVRRSITIFREVVQFPASVVHRLLHFNNTLTYKVINSAKEIFIMPQHTAK